MKNPEMFFVKNKTKHLTKNILQTTTNHKDFWVSLLGKMKNIWIGQAFNEVWERVSLSMYTVIARPKTLAFQQRDRLKAVRVSWRTLEIEHRMRCIILIGLLKAPTRTVYKCLFSRPIIFMPRKDVLNFAA